MGNLISYEKNDEVLLIRDFDNNITTKKSKLDPLGEKKGLIAEKIDENFYLVDFDGKIIKCCGNQLLLVGRGLNKET